jgi:hypothetical protein
VEVGVPEEEAVVPTGHDRAPAGYHAPTGHASEVHCTATEAAATEPATTGMHATTATTMHATEATAKLRHCWRCNDDRPSIAAERQPRSLLFMALLLYQMNSSSLVAGRRRCVRGSDGEKRRLRSK